MRLIFGGLLLVILAACAAPPPSRAPVKMGEEFTLSLGESVGVEQKGVLLKFEKVVEDSRCPMNARCIWEGNARIEIKVRGSAAAGYALNTSTRFNTSAKITDFVLELRRLEPDRIAGAETLGYVATLFVGVQ